MTREVVLACTDQVGRIDIANGAKSRPPALTQLLVGYHAVKAAMGGRAY
jgi:phosphoribulokinase